MKIHPVGAEFFCLQMDRQTYDAANSHFFAILWTRLKTWKFQGHIKLKIDLEA
jgi:hypothetical protein